MAATVCCAAGALLTLTQFNPLHNSTQGPPLSVEQCFDRCGGTCRGVGIEIVSNRPFGCSGLLYERSVGGKCPFGSTMLQNFVGNPGFGNRHNKGACHGPQCPVLFGKTALIAPHGNRPVRVQPARQPGDPSKVEGYVATFVNNKVPPRSIIQGPLTIRCTGKAKRIIIGAGATLNNVFVNCSADCPAHVQLNRKDGASTTTIINATLRRNVRRIRDKLAEAELCIAQITPVPKKKHPRDFVGRGNVRIETHYGHNVAVANIIGTLTIQNNATLLPTIATVLDSLEDAGGRLTIQSTGPGIVRVRNMTNIMAVFGSEYIIRFFHNGKDQRGTPVKKWARTASRYTVLLTVAVILAFPPRTMLRAFNDSVE